PTKGKNEMRRLAIFLLSALATLVSTAFLYTHASNAAPGAGGYKVSGKIPVEGEGGWDYLVVDEAARRISFSNATEVVVFDVDSHKVVGDVADTQVVHGIALAPELGGGFVSAGRGISVTISDFKSLKTLGTAPAGTNPDAILYDVVSKRV